MDYLGDKLNSATGQALSSVNSRARIRKDRAAEQQQDDKRGTHSVIQPYNTQTIAYGQSVTSPVPFGGDHSIGFRPELLAKCSSAPETRYPVAKSDSNESIYEGDAWSRLWFQRVMLLSLIRLLLFIRKVYEDYHATKTYSNRNQIGHFLISAATLFLPTIVFTIYRVARYLQLALSSARSSPSASVQPEKVRNKSAGANVYEDDGLVTATQTPTNLDEQFHDSRSQQEQAELTIALTNPGPSPWTREPEPAHQEPVRVVQQFADKRGAQVAIGASEQLLHGVLFVFWQLKRQVDVLGYLVERSCLWRKPKEREQVELERLRTGSDGLEWFQDFYAAFLAILAQVYTLGLNWTEDGAKEKPASAGLSSMSAASLGSEFSDVARGLAKTVGQQVALNLPNTDLLIMSQLVVSSAVVFSLLVAVRRRDDGPMTLLLSMLGWGSIFASRIIIIALAFVHIGWLIMLPLVACHTLGITGWIYKIALDSHNGKADESEESKWEDAAKTEEAHDNVINRSIELGGLNNKAANRRQEESPVTSRWSVMEHLVLLLQIVTLFALPSLFYWPIMFNLKLHCRPFKYLLLILMQNLLLIPTIWWTIPGPGSLGQWYLLGAVGAFSIVGFLFLFLYVSCKPSLTEYFARADELFNEAERSGIYFEFCSRVFKLPDLSKHAFRRLMNQTEAEVEEEVE